MPPVNPDLDLALRLADLADSMSLPAFRSQDHQVRTKPDHTPVTETDEAIEAALRAELARSRPGDAVLGEEGGASGNSRRRWILDPIDGTKNFMSGIPLYGTLIALEVDGVIEVAVVSMPALNRTRYQAVRGGGAWKSEAGQPDRLLHVNAVARPADGVLAWAGVGGLPAAAERRFHALRRRFFLNRKVGNTWAHMLVAEGVATAGSAGHIHEWDVAAPRLIVTEAGGRMTTWRGVDGVHPGTVVSSNGILHDALVAALEPAWLRAARAITGALRATRPLPRPGGVHLG